jgi:hypothetical protein
MATIRGWAVKLHLAKKYEAKIPSHGFGFDGPPVGKPQRLHFTFEREDKAQVEIILSPQEAEDVRLACVEFHKRRGA